MEKGLVSNKVQERINRNAFRYVKNLEKQSDEGSAFASVKLLEIGKIYLPASKQKLETEGKEEVTINVINSYKEEDD